MRNVPHFRDRGSRSFEQLIAPFLSHESLPFASALSAERIERIFKKPRNLFGGGQVYDTAIVLWSFLGQVLRDGKQASCRAAVARITTFRQQLGLSAPTSDTGDYCRARSKLSEAAIRDVSVEVAAEMEEHANSKWLWKGLHAKLVDGFTFTMPDTPRNQAAYPSPRTQKKGVGLPIARVAAITSFATACVLNLALGPYQGKETGESALLRELLGSFGRGDLAIMDRYFCSFMMISLLLQRGAQVCVRMHQKRHVDFRRGKRLGAYDHIIVWTKPAKPKWMDEATYHAIPGTQELREIRYSLVEPGFRTKNITIATTLIDPKQYSKADIAQLYGFRWNAELDIRSIKQSLNLAHVRCKSPEMVRKELWTSILAYNLIRTKAATAAQLHGRTPRQISFTATCQYVLASWMLHSCQVNGARQTLMNERQCLERIARCEVADRPGRVEPRVIKRRRHTYKLMLQPRAVLKQLLLKS